MIFQTANEFVVLGLCLIAGWFFGLASAPGTRKWKDRLRDEEIEHARTHERLASDAKDKDRRIAELEKENAKLAKERDDALEKARDKSDVAAGAVAGGAAVAAVSAATHDDDDTSAPAKGEGWRGWFGWGRDNLSRIAGIDDAREKKLNELGFKTYREIENMSAEDEAKLEERLDLEKGTIATEKWREQAKMLREGHESDHARQFADNDKGDADKPAADTADVVKDDAKTADAEAADATKSDPETASAESDAADKEKADS